MTRTVLQNLASEVVVRRAKDIQAEDITRDLELKVELEAFIQFHPVRSACANPASRQIREMAYEDREASLLIQRT